MLQEQETILRRIGNALRGQSEHITHETLPKRWVELIHYLDEEERKRTEAREEENRTRDREN